MQEQLQVRTNTIHHGSCLHMDAIPDGTIHLVVTSPPYNVEVDYGGHDDNMTDDAYRAFTRAWISECTRACANGGRLAINVANTGRNPYRFLTTVIIDVASELGLLPRGEIIWNKGAAVAARMCSFGSWRDAPNPTLRDQHEHVLIFSKGEYKLDCTGYEKSQHYSGTQHAHNTFSIWNVKPETRRFHPAPFPVELASRLIQLYTRPDQIVLDPFMGSGSTAVACVTLPEKRRFIGYEINPDYIKLAYKRIKSKDLARLEDYLVARGMNRDILQHVTSTEHVILLHFDKPPSVDEMNVTIPRCLGDLGYEGVEIKTIYPSRTAVAYTYTEANDR